MKNLSLGLDIGTNSVGWALVDENNQLYKKNGFTFWGVRMFEEAKTAVDRRTFRASRRRLQRRRQRLLWLQAEFIDEINKVDKNFFQRINDSFFIKEDKALNNQYTFFDDEKKDYDYFNQFPTIYHLRKYLMNTSEKVDIRLLYLACAHIIKYRGHFLNEGELFNKNDSTRVIDNFITINNTLNGQKETFEDDEDYFQEIVINDKNDFYNGLKNILVSNDSKFDKKNKLYEFFDVEKKSFVGEFIIPLLIGSDINVSSLKIVKDNKYEKAQLNLLSETLEEDLQKAREIVSELSEVLDIVPLLKEIADSFYLLKLIGDATSISDAMIRVYNKHQEDLKLLKAFIRKYLPEKYNECFREFNSENAKGKKEKICSYARYVGMNKTGHQIDRYQHCSRDDFYNYIRALFKKINNEEANDEIAYFTQEMDHNDFLIKQRSGLNTVIPMQLHLQELEQILNNQKNNYSFLLEVKDNYTVIERIISIFKYKIPYYVGPLNSKSSNSWLTRTNEKIYPWNIKQVVNFDESAKTFIQKMQNKCTYLMGPDDYCLPKKSLLFSEFNCLQYINKLKIDGKPITKDQKDFIYNEIFLKNPKPTRKIIAQALFDYIKSNTGQEVDISNIISNVNEVTCDMSSYITFKKIFKDEFKDNQELIENIIKDITIFEDKKILERRLKEVYKLDDEKIIQIKGLNYKGYASLCKNFLNSILGVNEKTGEAFGPIIQILRDTTLNLQQILFDKEYNFQKAIDDYNKQYFSKDNYSYRDYIEEKVYTSPMMKRSLIQSYNIINEIEKIIKQPITQYYIECTRTNKEKKGQNYSRYESLKELYTNCKNDVTDFSKFVININKLTKELDTKNNDLLSDKLYLYFTQLGKCMYTLEDIDLYELLSGDKYDIDHIYPQSLIKDDSINNRVLVSKKYNQEKKKDKFLFEVIGNNSGKLYAFYQLLLDKGLIKKEKYRRLTQKSISEQEFNGFINRQIVSTNQSVKGLISLLREYKGVENKDIIFSKGENISDFRKEFDFVKSRTANNYHHAHDAYLNVVIGRVIDTYYKKNVITFHYDFASFRNKNYTLKPLTILENDQYKLVNNEKQYYYKKDEVISLLNHNIKERFDINETTRTYNSNTMFNKVSILPASEGSLVPVKSLDKRSNTLVYGGITSNSYVKYCIVRVTNKKKNYEYFLEAIPKTAVGRENEYINSIYSMPKYLSSTIIIDNIKTNVLVNYNNKKFYITGKTGKQYTLRNAIDRNFSYKSIKIIKKIDKYFEQLKYKYEMEISENEVIVSKESKLKNSSGIIINRRECEKLVEEIITNFEKKIFSYSIINKIKVSLKKLNSLSMDDLLYTIKELLLLLKTNGMEKSNLSKIGLPEKSGTLYFQKKLINKTKFYENSYTGYYKQLIFEVPSGI